MFSAAVSMLPDYGWRSQGLWAIDTANANCFETCASNVLRPSQADVTLMQETKLHTEDSMKAAKRKARGLGWSAHFSPARLTDAAGKSGGCGVAAKLGAGIAPVDDLDIDPDLQHRIAISWVDAVQRGGIYCASAYLANTEGFTEYNMKVLQEAAAVVKSLKAPWAMGGRLEQHASRTPRH